MFDRLRPILCFTSNTLNVRFVYFLCLFLYSGTVVLL